MPLSSPAGSVNPFLPPTLRSQRARARPSARLRTLGVLPPGSARGGGRAGLGAPLTGRGAPAGPPRRTRAAAGTQGHPVDAGEQRRKPALKPAGTHRKAGDPPRTSEPGGRAGRLRRELTFARTEAFGAGAPRAASRKWPEGGRRCPPRSAGPEEGALRPRRPRPRPGVSPEPGGEEPSGPGAVLRPQPAAISGAARAAPATQCYRVRAAATSGHACTANS